MAKGKYYGPDKNKGVRPEPGTDKYYGPNKHKGIAPTKKKSPSKPTKKKPQTLKEQADELTNAQYAGALSEIGSNRDSNRNQYARYTKERVGSLGKELGSNDQTSQIVVNAINGRKADAMAAAKEAFTKQELSRSVRDEATKAANTNTLSNYEALMKSRGIDPTQLEGMKANLETEQGFTGRQDDINRKTSSDTTLAAGTAMDTLASQAQMAGFNAQANAKANAQKDLNSQYASTMTNDEKLAGELTKTQLDKGSSRLNTYLTLKKEYQQRKAEEAQSRLEAAVSMGKQASSDYFKEATLSLNRDKESNKQSNSDRAFDLKKQDTIAKWTKDAKNGTLNEAKFHAYLKKNGIQLLDLPKNLQKYATSINITSPSNPMNR